ncbi:MAG: hypothetical protein HYR56_07255 [Acidobacteria bacterium]|nr:hypothetical protein [Acidobacteriota bacterium]MBI3426764.1 hypothetical protein [Acidobacteriota bacterium]
MITTWDWSHLRSSAATLVLVGWALLGASSPPSIARAQEAMKQKGHIECYIKCCPIEIGCKWVSGSASATRLADPGAQITVNGRQLLAEFKPTAAQKVYEVKQETKLDAQTAEALGFKEITLLPGQYPLTQLGNGRAKVAIKVRTAGAKSKRADSSD